MESFLYITDVYSSWVYINSGSTESVIILLLSRATDTEPTDIELDQVGKEVLGKMREDWVFLMTYLEIPDDDQTVALSKTTIRQQVWYMLRQWRDGSADNTRARLAQRLKRFDRLRRVAHRLVKGEFMI